MILCADTENGGIGLTWHLLKYIYIEKQVHERKDNCPLSFCNVVSRYGENEVQPSEE